MSAPVEGRPPGEGQGKAPVAAQQPYQQPYDSRSDVPGSWPSNSHTEPHNLGLGLQRRRTEESNGQRDASPMRDHNDSDADQLTAAAPRKSGGSRRPSGSRICGKCGLGLTGQFVRALGDTYHLECFTCHVIHSFLRVKTVSELLSLLFNCSANHAMVQDCGKIVASKFFPVPDHPPNQYPLCETDYFRRLDLLCFHCGQALRGSYITALDRKYHIEHFTCSVCPTVFGAQDSYYEHEGSVFCHYHYSTKFAQRCNGCLTSILKQFVEIFRNGQNQHWHPECYMIHKYWNVRLHSNGQPVIEDALITGEATDEVRKKVRQQEEAVEGKVNFIWKTLSAFEEKSATCISDMLLHVSNGAYFDGVMAAKKFIVHVDLLFTAADNLDSLLIRVTPKGECSGSEQEVAIYWLLTIST
jgi:hypothetical protein